MSDKKRQDKVNVSLQAFQKDISDVYESAADKNGY